jgi:sec-independent protein translocase protein TatA
MGEFSPWHLLIVAAVFVLLFGAKKLPDAARSLGKSARILKTELKDIHKDDDETPTTVTTVQQVEAAPVVAAPVVAPPVTTAAPGTESQPVAAGEPIARQ